MFKPLTSPVYPRAPIIEAVIELVIADRVAPKDVERIAKKMKKRYDACEDQKQIDLAVQTDGMKMSVRQDAMEARRLSSNDQSRVAVVHEKALITSRLPPYPGWNALREDAHANWGDWKSVANSTVSRVGVRFINRIDIPTAMDNILELESYLTIYPQMKALQRPVTAFLVQASVDSHLERWSANITVTPFLPPPVPGHTSILLDIDVFRTDEIPNHKDKIWDMVDEGRAIKNDIFERVLTPEAKELFK